MSTILLIGLGNPGKDYEKNRHNIGFRVIDECINRFNLTTSGEKFNAKCFEGRLQDRIVKALKPTTYMNLSGKTALAVSQFYKVPPSQIWIIYDDFDIPFGKIKLRPQGSPGTHNGVKSVTQWLGTQAFPKLRLGIGPKPSAIPTDQFVLSDFNKNEEAELPQIIENATKLIQIGIEQGIQKAMNTGN